MTQLNLSRKKAIQGRIVGQPQLSRSLSLPAPVGGWNAVDSLTLMPPTDAISIYNLISRQSGVVTRPGYVTHAKNIGNSITTNIRSVAGFNDVTRDKTLNRDRLFAFTDQGIYDCTADTTNNPTLMPIYDGLGSITPIVPSGWQVKGGDAGWVSYTNFSNSIAEGGKHYLCVCDTINGYHVYDPDGGGANVGRWYKILQGATSTTFGPVNPTLLIDVQQYKGSLYFTERDSSRLWYLTPGTITGGTNSTAATAIDVGSRFPHGGFLKGAWAWTYNGGAGFDDFLVCVSSTGDVVVWEGASPTDLNWQIKGVWYIGDPPKGRQIAGNFNGDLFLLGAYGLVPMSRLVAGGADESPDKYITHKIQNLVRNYLRDQSRSFGWSVTNLPTLGLVVVNVPQGTLGRYYQLVLSTQSNAWSVFEGINALDWESFEGKEYAGLTDGRIVRLAGATDQLQLAKDTFEDASINWNLLTAYNSLEMPANWKRIHFVRPLLLTEQLPAYNVQTEYDFAIVVPTPISPPIQVAGPKWDSARWDVDYWGGAYEISQPVIGSAGMGRWVSVSMVGRSNKDVSIVGFDLVGDVGGML